MKKIIAVFITICLLFTACVDSVDTTPVNIEQMDQQNLDQLMNNMSDPDTLEGGNCPICPPKNP